MDSAVTAQLGFGGHSDPVTLSTEFKKYGWQVTGILPAILLEFSA